MKSTFKVRAKDLLGRLGEMCTKSGSFETPTLAPVISVSGGPLSPKEIKDMGFELIITNAYLWMRRGESRDIHSVLGIEGPVMTDSGAYQLLVYKSVDTTNEEIIRFQERINTDIGVVLDTPTGLVSEDEARQTVDRTIKSEQEALNLISNKDIIWTAPIQGGTYPTLLKRMIDAASALDYPLYALGSPTPLMEGHMYSKLFDVLYLTRMMLPPHKPLHLFGAGHPSIFSFAVALGADTFDSAAYALFAKEGRYMTIMGSEKLENLKEFPCTCPVCTTYKPSELLKMDKKEREKLLAKHNLYVSLAELRAIKNSIVQGKLWDLVESRARASPELWEVFERFGLYSNGFLYHTQLRKPTARGFSVIDAFSAQRPELLWHLESIKKLLSADNTVFVTTRQYINKAPANTYLVGFPFVITKRQLLKVYPLYFAKYRKPTHEEEVKFLRDKLPPLIKDKEVKVIGDAELFKALVEAGLSASLTSDK